MIYLPLKIYAEGLGCSRTARLNDYRRRDAEIIVQTAETRHITLVARTVTTEPRPAAWF